MFRYPPFYFVVAVCFIFLCYFLLPVPVLIPFPGSLIGFLFIILGCNFAISAIGQFRKRNTPVIPFRTTTYLVTEGPYRFSRNPMYFGLVLILLGIAICLATPGPFFIIPLFMLVIHWRFIAREEEALEKQFGAQYRAYCRQVRRWI